MQYFEDIRTFVFMRLKYIIASELNLLQSTFQHSMVKIVIDKYLTINCFNNLHRCKEKFLEIKKWCNKSVLHTQQISLNLLYD